MMGRPPFEVTPANRDRVAFLTACRMLPEHIALLLGCTVKTLRKHFKYELTGGAVQYRERFVGLLRDSAEAGNVSAQKHMEAISREPDAAAAAEPGKKEIRQARAEKSASDGTFAAPSAPKLIVSNG